MRKEFCTIGPVPAAGIVAIMTELERQYWKTSHLAFAGYVTETASLALTKPVPTPAYVIVAEKCFNEDETFVPPVIKQFALS